MDALQAVLLKCSPISDSECEEVIRSGVDMKCLGHGSRAREAVGPRFVERLGHDFCAAFVCLFLAPALWSVSFPARQNVCLSTGDALLGRVEAAGLCPRPVVRAFVSAGGDSRAATRSSSAGDAAGTAAAGADRAPRSWLREAATFPDGSSRVPSPGVDRACVSSPSGGRHDVESPRFGIIRLVDEVGGGQDSLGSSDGLTGRRRGTDSSGRALPRAEPSPDSFGLPPARIGVESLGIGAAEEGSESGTAASSTPREDVEASPEDHPRVFRGGDVSAALSRLVVLASLVDRWTVVAARALILRFSPDVDAGAPGEGLDSAAGRAREARLPAATVALAAAAGPRAAATAQTLSARQSQARYFIAEENSSSGGVLL